jgi:hypothetical protein
VALSKKRFGNRSIHRERQIIFSLILLVIITITTIYFGIRGFNINFDFRNQAAGKVYFVENNQDLQTTINKAVDSDAIFLKVGSYTPVSSEGFLIKDKNIRILGAGSDFVNISGTNKSYVFKVENASVKFEGVKISGANKDGVLITNNNSKEVSFKDVEISNNSGDAIKTDSKISISTSLISQNAIGIETSKDLSIDNTLIQNISTNAIQTTAGSTSNLTIKNSIITNATGTAILLQGAGTNEIRNDTLFNNGKGIIETGTSTTTVINTIVQGSKSDGIVLKGSSKATFTNSFSNQVNNFNPTSLSTLDGNLSLDSGFVSISDLHLKTTSPLIDKGATSEKDSNGSRIDIGAFGGNANLTASNAAPTISSTPPEFIKPGQNYNYEVKATDPDSDALNYVILNSNYPKWIKLSANKLSGTPSTSDVGFGGVLLLVTDKKGHNIVQAISLNVIPEQRTLPPTTGTNPTPTTTPSIPNPAAVAEVSILTPNSNSTFSGTENEIKWSVTGGAQIDKFVIKYSADQENFQTITTLPGTQTSYKWDTSSLIPGKYFIRIEATDKGTPPATINEISDQFEIKAPITTTPTTPAGAITITKTSPKDNDEITTRKPSIIVEFKPDAEIDKTKTTLTVKGENVEYSTTKNTIFYDPKTNLTGNKIQVEVKIVTKDGAEAQTKWTFNLPTTTNTQDTTVTTTPNQTILGLPRAIGLILLAVLIVGLLLLILYFVLKLFRTIREERQGNLEAEFTEYYGPTTPATTTTVVTQDRTPTSNDQISDISYQSSTSSPVPVIEEHSTLTQISNPQPAVQEHSTVVETQDIDANQYLANNDQTFVDNNQTEQLQTNPKPQIETTPSTTAVTSSATDISQPQTNTQQNPTDQSPSTTQNTTNQSVAPQQDSAYIDDLKKKYGITETDIEQYKKQEEVTVVDKNNNTKIADDLGQITPPDNTGASTPPKTHK